MKKKLKFYIFTILIIILASCLFIAKKINEKNLAEANIAKIPKFSFITINRHSFSNSDIDISKTKFIINHFSPTCEHCQYMAGEFLKKSKVRGPFCIESPASTRS